MKATFLTTALIAMFTLFSSSVFATDFDFEEEAYIDDIPFDTEEIYLDELWSEETDINDIPFNTELIAANARLNNYNYYVFMMEEETYVDDIPFDTEAVVDQINFKQAVSTEFAFDDEEYVDDIPFSTEEVAQKTEVNPQILNYMMVDFLDILF